MKIVGMILSFFTWLANLFIKSKFEETIEEVKETIDKEVDKGDIRLSPNFYLSEFTRSTTAINLGIDNTPNQEQLRNLKALAQALEEVRHFLGGKPLVISSGLRTELLNKAVGGSSTSGHLKGHAVDFTVKGMTTRDACMRIANSNIKFDQLIYEQGANSEWVHFSIAPKMRRDILSWKKSKGYIRDIVKL